VQQPGPADRGDVIGRQAGLARRAGRELGNAAGVPDRIRRFEIGEIGHRAARGVELRLTQVRPRPWLDPKHGIPGRLAGQIGHERGSVLAEPLCDPRVVGAACAFAGDRDRRLEAAQPLKRHRILREGDNPHRRCDRLALERGHALAIPARIQLPQRVDDRRLEAHALGQALGHLAVAAEEITDGGSCGQEPAHHRLGHPEGRYAGVGLANVARHHPQHLGRLAVVDHDDLAAERDLVADDRREHVGLGVAADIAQQRLVVDLAKLAFAQATEIAQPHRQHARAQRELERLAHPQVGRQRERGHKLGQADIGAAGGVMLHDSST